MITWIDRWEPEPRPALWFAFLWGAAASVAIALIVDIGISIAVYVASEGASDSAGDFFGSGTVSGPEKDQRGSFLELSWGGKEPFALPGGTEMTFLADGQSVTLTGTAPGPGGSVIDLGECTATILPAT